jgi:hypothetical protein
MKRSLRLMAAGVVAAATAFAVMPAQAQSSFSFGFSDRGSRFSMGVNDGYYRPYYDYGPRYYARPGYYGYHRPYRDYYRPYERHRVQVYDPYLGRYVWVWR